MCSTSQPTTTAFYNNKPKQAAKNPSATKDCLRRLCHTAYTSVKAFEPAPPQATLSGIEIWQRGELDERVRDFRAEIRSSFDLPASIARWRRAPGYWLIILAPFQQKNSVSPFFATTKGTRPTFLPGGISCVCTFSTLVDSLHMQENIPDISFNPFSQGKQKTKYIFLLDQSNKAFESFSMIEAKVQWMS